MGNLTPEMMNYIDIIIGQPMLYLALAGIAVGGAVDVYRMIWPNSQVSSSLNRITTPSDLEKT